MTKRHTKSYYFGGLISLMFLPLLFFVSTTEIRKTAVSYGSIEIILPPDDPMVDYFYVPESTYVFTGNDERAILVNFRLFFQIHKNDSAILFRANLPERCSYNFVVQVLDILQTNKFGFNILHNAIAFSYQPNYSSKKQYEPASMAEEIQYVCSKLAAVFSTAWFYVGGEPPHQVRILQYSDLGPPPEKIKLEPRTAQFFRVVGLWFIPIISLWTLLFFFSISRNRRLLPNQRLKLTD